MSLSIQQEVARLAGLPEIRAAFSRFRAEESQFAQWQMEVSRVPAPPFGESARSEWLADRFQELGLESVQVDEVGNVFAVSPGYGQRFVSISAHIDTVFPASTPLNIRQEGSRLYGPGVSDNGAGIAAMLAIASVLRSAEIVHTLPFVFIARRRRGGRGRFAGHAARLSNAALGGPDRLQCDRRWGGIGHGGGRGAGQSAI